MEFGKLIRWLLKLWRLMFRSKTELAQLTNSFAGGANDSPAYTPERHDQAKQIFNGRIREDGSVKCRDGSKYTNSTAWTSTPNPADLTEFVTNAGVNVWVGTCRQNGMVRVSTDYGATWVQLSSVPGPHTGPITSCVATDGGVRQVAIGGIPGSLVVVLDASGADLWTTGTTQSPVANPVFVESHADRLWVAEADSQTLYGSAIDDMDNWATPDGIVLTIGGDGEPIRGLKSTGTHLLVFKETKIAYVDGYGNSDILVASGTKGIPTGASVFAKTAVITPYGLIFTTSAGVFAFSDTGAVTPLSGAISEWWNDSYWATVTDPYPTRGTIPQAVYLPDSHEYIVGIQASSGTTTYGMDRLVRINLKTGAITVDSKSGDPITAMMAARTSADDGRLSLITMGPAGLARVHDVSTTHSDDTTSAGVAGSTYSMSIRTRNTDFGVPGRKRLRKVTVRGEFGAAGGAMAMTAGADEGVDGTGVYSSQFTLTFAASAKVQTTTARPSLRGEDFYALVTANPTSAYRPVIESVKLYAEKLHSARDF
jgi:hypothetical protein